MRHLMRYFDKAFWWDILMSHLRRHLKRHFDETFWWNVLIGHFYKSFWWDILMRHFDEKFWWDIWLRNFDETIGWTSLWHIFMTNLFKTFLWLEMAENWSFIVIILDCVSPVDHRPSPDSLHHFVQKSNEIKYKIKYIWHIKPVTWHLTLDTWHAICDMWHVTCDMWHMLWDEHNLKISALQLSRLGIDSVLKILSETMTQIMTTSID